MKIEEVLSESDALVFTKTEFRNNLGVLVGTTERVDKRIEARDRNGRLVGYFDIELNRTRDWNNRFVGTGDQLSSLFLIFTKK